MFRASYLLIIVICIAPVVPGLLGVILSSLGYIPPVGLHHFSLDGYIAILQWSGVGQSLLLSIGSALISTYLAAAICFVILQSLWHSRHWSKVENALSPLLAMPHVAFAIGFAFLFSPSGMMDRLLYHLLGTSFMGDGASLLVRNPYAVGLTLALALKEVPFLLLMSIPILQQLNIDKLQQAAASLGYSQPQLWLKVIFPQWLNKLRFALFAVIAYGVSVVDLALILGPNNPPTFAVLVWQWFSDPNLALIPRAAAGAVLLFILASAMLLIVLFIEKCSTQHYKRWQYSGRYALSLPGKSLFLFIITLSLLMLPLMVVWSFAQRWRFPDLWPSQFSTRFWDNEWLNIAPTIYQSVQLALFSTVITLVLSLLAHEYKLKYQRHLPSYLIALPMLIPQLSLLFGMQIATLFLASDQYWLWVTWSHVFFAFPFVYLALDGPWKSYNQNLTKAALSLGKTPWQVFWQIKTPQLLPAIIYAAAVGMSVSLAQYLPTLMLGAGRIATITTEAVALSSGFDRRVTAIYAIWQALLPLIFFTLAIVISRLQTHRRTMNPIVKKTARKEAITHDVLPRKPRHP